MAEENTAEKVEVASTGAAPEKKNILMIVQSVFNIVALLGVGVLVYKDGNKVTDKDKLTQVLRGVEEAKKLEEENENFIGNLLPLETFLVNLSGSNGTKLAKVNMELELNSDEVQSEIDKLKPKIRDIIIIILSSKTYAQVSSKEGKNELRTQIKDKVNLFLTKGQIKRVYFTEFIFN